MGCRPDKEKSPIGNSYNCAPKKGKKMNKLKIETGNGVLEFQFQEPKNLGKMIEDLIAQKKRRINNKPIYIELKIGGKKNEKDF